MSAESTQRSVKVSGERKSEGQTWYGLGTAGVGDADELVEQDGVLVVVPVAEDDGELLVV